MQPDAYVYLLPAQANPNNAYCQPQQDFLALPQVFRLCKELDSHARRMDPPRVIDFGVLADTCRVGQGQTLESIEPGYAAHQRYLCSKPTHGCPKCERHVLPSATLEYRTRVRSAPKVPVLKTNTRPSQVRKARLTI